MTSPQSPKPRFKAVLFDLDGTAADCFEDIRLATNHAMRELGLPEHDMDAIKSFVGHGVDHLCKLAVGEKADLAGETKRLLSDYYGANPASASHFYEGVPELIRDLRAGGVRVGLASNKTHILAVKAVEGMGGADLFDDMQGEVPEMPRKPAPDTLLAILKRMGAQADASAAMIGDGIQDVQAARNAGVTAVAVTWGAGREQDLKAAKPDALVRTVAGLREFLFA